MKAMPLFALYEHNYPAALNLATEFGFLLLALEDWMHCLSEPYCLVLSDRRLYLMPSPEPEKIKSGGEWGAYLASGKGAIFVDFAGGKNCHRRQFGGGKSQSIAKAVGIRSGFFPSVLDVTAGFGADAFVLASLGSTVVMLERNPVIFSLLRDGIERALANTEDSELVDILGRMSLHHKDACQYLQQEQVLPQVVYYDPMFPGKKKQAASNKTMVAFQHIVGKDEDELQLMRVLMESGFARVVVKRPRLADPLFLSPELVFKGKSGRFDVYPRKKLV